MKRAALASALTSQLASGNVVIVDGMGDLSPKTKDMAKALSAVGASKKTLLVTPPASAQVVRSARNIVNIDLAQAGSLNAYTVLSHEKIVFMKDAVRKL